MEPAHHLLDDAVDPREAPLALGVGREMLVVAGGGGDGHAVGESIDREGRGKKAFSLHATYGGRKPRERYGIDVWALMRAYGGIGVRCGRSPVGAR